MVPGNRARAEEFHPPRLGMPWNDIFFSRDAPSPRAHTAPPLPQSFSRLIRRLSFIDRPIHLSASFRTSISQVIGHAEIPMAGGLPGCTPPRINPERFFKPWHSLKELV